MTISKIYIEYVFLFVCGCIIPGDSIGNGAASQEGKREQPPCHVMHKEVEDEIDAELAGLPPARKRAQQQRGVEAVQEEEGEAEQDEGKEDHLVDDTRIA